MDENKRNRQQPTSEPAKDTGSKQGETQPASNEQAPDPNPQQGGSWNNYQTRELSADSKEESYRPSSAEDEGGGNLY